MQKSPLKPSLTPSLKPAEAVTERSGRSRRRRVAAVAACVAVLGLFGTACSDDGDTKSKSSEAAGSGKTDEDKRVAYHKCLRDNGLKVGEAKPGQDERGVSIGADDKASAEKAMKACRDKAPNGGAGKKLSQADKDKALKFAKCMRENGYNMPDPEFKGGMQKPRKAPQGEERQKFEKANKACAGLSR
ncbi:MULTISPECIES: hypothetical protein [unclassified Streptomyces]|uniref:hypothetical protein n=1 Tax=unclassified Streptomyces TaxID=2593676 RepID=UPI002DD940DC|nr:MULTISPECIES: hypothetical protein [unclassified Streptomyces]WSA91415.1 hypothetical protein OIE63_07475 [Streptomyces sp. NBC_01795]WSB75739.1 hypothetical protein OHB04_08000 [Streptomyces sp. NBC_01775]WSS44794.1 hypothetical protein OG220_32565 [Streptomyces sp. NBC_01187]